MTEWEPGTIVIVTAPDYIRGKKIAVILEKCKDHPGSWKVELMDQSITTRKICVGINQRDSIETVGSYAQSS